MTVARTGRYPRPTNLPLLAAACDAECIVDLGGGSGWTSELLYQAKNGKNKNYIVLEIPSICEEFSSEFHEDSGVLFFSSITEVPKHLIMHTDILYANSVLQYFPDDSILTELISFLLPEWILLDDFVTSANETFYSLQNYQGVGIPYRFSSLFDIQETCTELGYELMVNLDYPSPIAAGWEARILGNNDLGSSIGRNASLLFRKLP